MCDTLRVDFGTCPEAPKIVDFDDGVAGYRVELLTPAGHVTSTGRTLLNDEWLLLPTKFARKRDAELARLALIDAGLDTAESLLEAGFQRMRAVMASALQW
jgi:hypothetical protein